MSFEQELELPTGVVVNFWDVTNIGLNPKSGEVDTSCDGYISQDAFNSGKQSVHQISFRFTAQGSEALIAQAGMVAVMKLQEYILSLSQPPVVE